MSLAVERGISRARLAGRVREAIEAGSLIITAGAGSGKTTILEQALSSSGAAVAWVSCSDAERVPGTLLMRIFEAVASAAPGASDALAERLRGGLERVDPLAATRELVAELSRLLVEPLVLVMDDAEHLDGAEESELLLAELIRAEVPLLHVAVASRRALELRVAKPRAAGRLAQLGATDLAFDAEECAELLRARSDLDPSPEQVGSVMEATEGWPLGIALAAGLVGREALSELSSAPDLQAYLSEELLESLDPELRKSAIDSSVVRVITPGVARALELPEDFGERIERAGLLVRRADDVDGIAYHPLLREFLGERLGAERGRDDQRRLHAAVAPAIAAGGDRIEAIEHWLESESWPAAVEAIERVGPGLLRTSPELLTRWFERLPEEVQALPTIQMLEGQLEWSAGQHQRAAVPLRQAVEGHRAAKDPEREWLARFFLAEALFSAGEFEEMLELAEGWDGPVAPRSHTGAAGAAWYKVLALTALGRREEANRLAERLRRDSQAAEQFRYLDDLATLLVDLAAGRSEEALAGLHATVQELEVHDPQGRLAVSLAVTGMVHLDIGEVDAAMEWFKRCQAESQRLGLGFIARDAHLQRASLLARRGQLDEARRELEAAGTRQGTGWRGVSRPTAEAFVAAAGGDADEAVAAAERALQRVRPGLVCYRVWAALDMAIVLAQHGAPERARSAIDEAMAALDEHYPGALGSYHRARLLAARAWLEYDGGRGEAAYECLRESWREAGDGATHVARAHWKQLEPIVWQALADGAAAAEFILPALVGALPGGEALIDFIDHPEAEVRRRALPAALTSNHPKVLSQLDQLIEDRDERVAEAAAAAQERLRKAPPPLRYQVLGRFCLVRAGREIGADSWSRPVDARLVKFLLVHRDEPVPEDLIIEALWPELSASSARRSLQVAVSRVRKVLDMPRAERTKLEGSDRTYRLVLAPEDEVDAEEFRSAADAALAAQGDRRRELLELARSYWAGEPMPEERYSDWIVPYRERLVDRYVSVLTALIELHERAGEPAQAVDAARELVDLDPLNEAGQRALMTSYARMGRRGHALRQYLECRRALVDGLGVEPDDSTTALQARILAGEPV